MIFLEEKQNEMGFLNSLKRIMLNYSEMLLALAFVDYAYKCILINYI